MTFYDQSFLYINRKGEENRSLETFRTFSVLTATTLEQMHLFWTLSERNQRKSVFRFGLVNSLRTVDSSDSWCMFFILGKKLTQKPFLESGNRISVEPPRKTHYHQRAVSITKAIMSFNTIISTLFQNSVYSVSWDLVLQSYKMLSVSYLYQDVH